MVKLRQDRSFRLKEGSALAVGKKLVLDLSKTLLPTRILSCVDFPFIFGVEKIETTEEIIKKISGLITPDGVVAEFPLPDQADLSRKKRILILDGLSDPGNVGTLFRTALALGWEGVFLTPETTDPFNDKALRASQGSAFLLPFQQGSIEELKNLLKKGGFTTYVADLKGKEISQVKGKEPLALILGSEGSGPCQKVKDMAEAISIPMEGQIESLNVAIAGGILMHALKGPV